MRLNCGRCAVSVEFDRFDIGAESTRRELVEKFLADHNHPSGPPDAGVAATAPYVWYPNGPLIMPSSTGDPRTGNVWVADQMMSVTLTPVSTDRGDLAFRKAEREGVEDA